MCTYVPFMATKTITITEAAYEKLKLRKKENESFSDVINRVMPYTDWNDFVGIFSQKSASNLERSIRKMRRETEQEVARVAKLMRGAAN